MCFVLFRTETLRGFGEEVTNELVAASGNF
jgi:hypothetical protein